MTIDGANPAVCKIDFEEVYFSLFFSLCLILERSHYEFQLKNTYIAYIALDTIGFIIDISNKRHYANVWCQRKCFVLFQFQFLFHFLSNFWYYCYCFFMITIEFA